MSKTVRLLIVRDTRADLRAPNAEDSDLQLVLAGEVHEVTPDVAENLIHAVAAQHTKLPVKHRFQKDAEAFEVVSKEQEGEDDSTPKSPRLPKPAKK